MNKQCSILKLGCLAAVGLAALFVQNAPAQTWTDADLNGFWADPNNWNPVGVPGDAAGTTIFINPAAGPTCTITNGEVESVGTLSDHSSTYGSTFGPEFGASLNIYGTLNFDWVFAPVQNNPTLANRTYINIYDTGQVNGVNFACGDQWFYHAAPYITVNMYGHATANVTNLWTAGHINLYDNSVLTAVSAVIDQGLNYADSDGTKTINIAGGQLITVTGIAGQFINYAQRGFLLAYGVPVSAADITTNSDATSTTYIIDNAISIVDTGTNLVVSNDPISGSLSGIAFQPLLVPDSWPGTVQQSVLLGTYPGAAKGVVLSSAEPGIDLATKPVYTSSNPNVFTVDANGLITSVSPGTATLTATLASFSASATVKVKPFGTIPDSLTGGSSLIHRYSFSETSGTTTADSVGGSAWNGTVNGTATLASGQLQMDGTEAGYVQLPAGVVSNLSAITIETWASFGPTLANYCVLFGFGGNDTNSDANAGLGENYIAFQPHTGATPATAQQAFGQGLPGFTAETDAAQTQVLDGMSNVHIVVIYNPSVGRFSYYTNGVLAASAAIYNNLTSPSSFNGPFYNKSSILANVLGTDYFNYIGHSLYDNDPPLAGSVDEFRIYNAALQPSQIKADFLLGPNQLVGANTHVSLAVSVSGGNLVVTWPTNSAYVNLVSSPAFGAAAKWTPVANGSLSIVGSNFQETVPMSLSTQFFGLE